MSLSKIVVFFPPLWHQMQFSFCEVLIARRDSIVDRRSRWLFVEGAPTRAFELRVELVSNVVFSLLYESDSCHYKKNGP